MGASVPLDNCDCEVSTASFLESDKVFTIVIAATLIASLRDSLRALFGVVSEKAGIL